VRQYVVRCDGLQTIVHARAVSKLAEPAEPVRDTQPAERTRVISGYTQDHMRVLCCASWVSIIRRRVRTGRRLRILLLLLLLRSRCRRWTLAIAQACDVALDV
jgi:hypothetical protein